MSEQQMIEAYLGEYQDVVGEVAEQLESQQIRSRIWAHDYTVWRPDPTEITDRLGWLHLPDMMDRVVDRINRVVEEVQAAGYTHLLLLGMGGSSLAPELFRLTFGVKEGYLELAVVDSTDPDAIRAHETAVDLERTLFIVATKSGGTVETLSFFKHFYNRMVATVGEEQAGSHFIAITDPGSKLVGLAEKYQFRDIFLNDSTIGGRYSVLSFFGLLPAALVGVDLSLLLERAREVAHNDGGIKLGGIMGALAQSGRDKLTLLLAPQLLSFGNWVEQLVAESTGKEGVGILPIVGEALGSPEQYGADRLFVHLHLDGIEDESLEAGLASLIEAGYPVVTLRLRDLYDLGGQFFLWEMGTAVASGLLGIQPFDQPDVESAKKLANKMVGQYLETGVLPEMAWGSLSKEGLDRFLAQAEAGDYIALHAYIAPTAAVDRQLQQLRMRLRDQYKLATTIGYGPRFLHSTGQLHKGDRGNGLFIQLVSQIEEDVPIPDEAGSDQSGMGFEVLKQAQAYGDGAALVEAGRRLLRLKVGSNGAGLEKL